MFLVVTDYNGWQQTHACLDRLRASSFRQFSVIVVDHGTTDETENRLRASYPEVICVRESPTLWWAGATNAGIREALKRGATSLVLLNNDCCVSPDTLAVLAQHAQATTRPAIIAALQRDARSRRLLGNFATSCFLLGFPTLLLPWPRRARPGAHGLLPTRLIMGGRGVLIPRAVFDRIGMLDEAALPHYGADHDFYLRCRRQGTPLYLALDAFVDVDDTRTTRATRPGRMPLPQFLASLADRRSHRNVRDLSTLFRRHYPIPGMHYAGVLLNLFRYSLLYIAHRLIYLSLRR